ncbi:hypothetical protein BH23VER1_BH23VER1_04390 [soil metagenome]
MADQSMNTQMLDESSAPANFKNKAPFAKKKKQKDPFGNVAMAAGVIAIIVSVMVVGLSFVMST